MGCGCDWCVGQPPTLGFGLQVTNPIPHWRTSQAKEAISPRALLPFLLCRGCRVSFKTLLGGSPSMYHIWDCEVGRVQG